MSFWFINFNSLINLDFNLRSFSDNFKFWISYDFNTFLFFSNSFFNSAILSLFNPLGDEFIFIFVLVFLLVFSKDFIFSFNSLFSFSNSSKLYWSVSAYNLTWFSVWIWFLISFSNFINKVSYSWGLFSLLSLYSCIFSSANTWTKVSMLSLIYFIRLNSSFFDKFDFLSLSIDSVKLSLLDFDSDYNY